MYKKCFIEFALNYLRIKVINTIKKHFELSLKYRLFIQCNISKITESKKKKKVILILILSLYLESLLHPLETRTASYFKKTNKE